MAKGNKPQKDDKANMKPKKDKPKDKPSGFAALSELTR